MLFLTTLPSYLIGFSCIACYWEETGVDHNHLLSVAPCWLLALAIGLGPSALSLLSGSLLPEAWPCTAAPLFMFRGGQARRLSRWCMVGDQRLVLATDKELLTQGAVVAHFGPAGARAYTARCADCAPTPVVHDAIMRVCSFTLVHSERILAALCSKEEEALARAEMIEATEAWLRSSRRLFERKSGKALLHAAFVRVVDDPGGVTKLAEILHDRRSV